MEHVRVLKTWSGGVEDKKAVPVDVVCFNMCVERTLAGFAGSKTAMALDERGMKIIPDLEVAEVVGFYGNGFKVRGVCSEQVGNQCRRVYCEWFVFYPKTFMKA